ncbi:MAG: co-chaperone GroES family protein [Pseudomonadota bacterium]|nr:co-chaperone GroES family protein [Pseudomonadota bacterium]
MSAVAEDVAVVVVEAPMEDLIAELGEKFFASMPRPVYWRVLIRPKQPLTKSKGGIEIPKETRIAQAYQNYIGQILAAGGEAFTSERFAKEKQLPRVGDWVVYGRYAGQRLEYRGEMLLIVNDDEILARISHQCVDTWAKGIDEDIRKEGRLN